MKSLQGDVMGILDSLYNVVARYDYDSWGKLIKITDESGNDITNSMTHIGYLNPIRYRSYYYDNETGWYYLQQRYYDPNTGRFLNEDSYISTGGLLGNNMYVYCQNSPISNVDFTGEFIFIFGETFVIPEPFIEVNIPTLPTSVTVTIVVDLDLEGSSEGGVVDALEEKEIDLIEEKKVIGRRIECGHRKAAEEAARRAGKGKPPKHHPYGHPGNRRPHFHPNVKAEYRTTPHMPCEHDHYFYSYAISFRYLEHDLTFMVQWV